MYEPNRNEVPNDIIVCQGKEYLVTKFNPQKFKATDLATGKTWNIPYYMAEFVRKATNADRAFEVELANTAFVLGEVVHFKLALYVVLGVTGTGLKLAKLGGDHDKYYRNVPLKSVQKVELSAILA